MAKFYTSFFGQVLGVYNEQSIVWTLGLHQRRGQKQSQHLQSSQSNKETDTEKHTSQNKDSLYANIHRLLLPLRAKWEIRAYFPFYPHHHNKRKRIVLEEKEDQST